MDASINKPDASINGGTYTVDGKYMEVRVRGLNRDITLNGYTLYVPPPRPNAKGVKVSTPQPEPHTALYSVGNPHPNPAYNKDQPGFYAAAIEAIKDGISCETEFYDNDRICRMQVEYPQSVEFGFGKHIHTATRTSYVTVDKVQVHNLV